jgi:O-antigen/teichoic acid export membrane protein
MRKLLHNSVFSLLSTVFLRLSSVILFVVVVRKLGEDISGIYVLATTYTAIFLSLSFWGLDQLIIRDVSRDRKLASRYWFNLGLMRIFLAGITIGLLYIFLLVIGKYPIDKIKLILLMGLSLIPDGLDKICQAFFIAIEELLYISLTSLLLALFRLAGSVLILWWGNLTVGKVIGVFLVSSILRCLVSVGLVLRKLAPIKLDIDPSLLLQSSIWGFSFIFVDFFIVLEAQLGPVLISVLGTDREIGLYGAAQAIVVALQMIPQAFRVAVFPTMSRLYTHEISSFRLFYRQCIFYLLILSLGLVPSMMILAPDLVIFLYGRSFSLATSSFQILVISMIFRLLNIPNSRLMIIVNQQKWLALFLGFGLAGNSLVSLILIPRFGFEMAALGQVVSMFIFFLANSLFVYHHILKIKLMPWIIQIPIALGSSLIIDLLLLKYSSIPLPIIAFISLILYTCFLMVLHIFPQEDIKLLKQLLRLESPADSSARGL